MCNAAVAGEIDHVEHHGMRSRLGVFPIGANWQSICEAMASERFAEHLRTYTNQFQGKSLVLSVERLDYTKGMPQKLAAIERYLEEAHEAKARRTRSACSSRAQSPEVGDVQNRERADRIKELQERFEERKGAGRKSSK